MILTWKEGAHLLSKLSIDIDGSGLRGIPVHIGTHWCDLDWQKRFKIAKVKAGCRQTLDAHTYAFTCQRMSASVSASGGLSVCKKGINAVYNQSVICKRNADW